MVCAGVVGVVGVVGVGLSVCSFEWAESVGDEAVVFCVVAAGVCACGYLEG